MQGETVTVDPFFLPRIVDATHPPIINFTKPFYSNKAIHTGSQGGGQREIKSRNKEKADAAQKFKVKEKKDRKIRKYYLIYLTEDMQASGIR
jgi:hypothetical protein